MTHIDQLVFLASFDIRLTELVKVTKYLAIVSAAAGSSIIQENDCDRWTVVIVNTYKYIHGVIINKW